MDFRVLGPLEVVTGASPVRIGGARRRALLAALLLQANEVVASDRLIDDLWGEHPPQGAANALQVHVSGLRKAFAEADGPDAARLLVSRPPGYVVELGEDQLDLRRFERLHREGNDALDRGEPERAAAKLREALALWRGPPLEDLRLEPSLQIAIAALEDARLAALEARISADLALGAAAQVVPELERLVPANPLHEGLRAHLMLALYRAGRQADSLEVFRATRQTLVEELGIEPGPRLQELHKAILAQDPALNSVPAPVAVTAAGRVSKGFVGRTSELEQLARVLSAAGSGRGSIALIGGDAGIGKTRLATELEAQARGRAFAVHWGHCWEAGGAPPYWPWVQALRSYVRECDDASLQRRLGADAQPVVQILPELSERLALEPAERSTSESDADRFLMFDAVTSFLRASSREDPLMLVLDDLHAADEPSLLLLRFLARDIASAQIVVVGTYRDRELDPSDPRERLLAEVAREPVALALSLRGLARDEVTELVEQTMAVDPESGIVAALHERTEGNPLFVGEIVRLLAAQSDADAGRTLPPTVHAVIGRRLGRISDESRSVLDAASVVGRGFRIPAVALATDRTPEEVVSLLDDAAGAGIATADPANPMRWRFSHVLVRDVLYEELSASRRSGLHHRLGEAMETIACDDPDHFAEIARHYLAAGPHSGTKGVDFSRRAGDRAMAVLAFEEAARHYESAIEALESMEGATSSDRCDLLLGLGDAHARAGDAAASKDAFWRAAETAIDAVLPTSLARAALGFGGRFVWGRASMDDRLLPLLERALEMLGTEDPRLRILVMARIAGATRTGSLSTTGRDTGDYAREMGRRAVNLGRELGDAETLAYALEAYLYAVVGPDTTQERLALSTEMIELASDPERLFAGHENQMHASWELGDMAAVRSEFDELVRLGSALRQRTHSWMTTALRASLALADGELDVAEQAIGAAFEVGRSAQSGNAEITHAIQSFNLWRARGRPEDVESIVRSAIEHHPTYAMLRCASAYVDAFEGREDAARENLRWLAANRCRALPRDDTWLYATTVLADTCSLLMDRECAVTIATELSPYADRIAYVPPDGSAGPVAAALVRLRALTSTDPAPTA